MHSKLHTYSPFFKTSLAMLFVLVFTCSKADNTQVLSKLSLQTIKSGAGSAAPSMVYNKDKNEYFLVYSDFDAVCSGNERLFGVTINAVTGIAAGSAVPISDCNNSVAEEKVFYNPELNEYGIIYKSVAAFGSKVMFQTVKVLTGAVSQSIELDSDDFGDPFNQTSIAWNSSSSIYSLGYHQKITASDNRFFIKYVGNQALKGYQTSMDKSTFASLNDGIKSAKMLPNANNILITFELKLATGSEIWGGFINPITGALINSYFKISPSPAALENFLNPALVANTKTGNFLVAYEHSYYQTTSGALNNKIKVQLINGTSGSLIAPMNQAVTNLQPIDPEKEDAKLPTLTYSALSNEYLIFFYGAIWESSSSIPYGTYLQRIDANSITSINTSELVASNVGTTISQNNSLRSLGIAHNSKNNQFLLGWNVLTGNVVQTQVWRFVNNLPANLDLTVKTQNENLAVGTTFSSITATDPDPEDTNLTYAFVSGTGGEDNSFFTTQGNNLKIAKNLNYEASATRKVKIKVTDSHGQSVTQSFVLTIKNVNERPYGMALSGTLTVEENAPSGSYTANISALDEDNGDTQTYTLVAGDSADNNGNFSIQAGTNILKLDKSLNFETTPKQFVRIMATDNGGLTRARGFMIQVIDINEEPERMELSTNSFPENDSETAADVLVIDPDANSNYLASLTSGVGGEDNNLFILEDNILKPRNPLNFETKNIYSVKIRAYDGTYEANQQFTINVIDENDAPDEIKLSDRRIETDQYPGSDIGELSTVDQDAGDTFTYTLISGTEYFFISGTKLRMLNTLYFDDNVPENNLYSVTVRSTDSKGAFKDETFTIEVVLLKDDEDPEINGLENIPTYLSDETDSLKFTVTATDNEKLDTVYFYYRPIRSTGDFIKYSKPNYITKTDDKLYKINIALDAANLDEMGVEYYFIVRDAVANTITTESGFTYRSYKTLSFTPTGLSYNGDTESYKIIANPFDLEPNKVSKIFADYGSSSEKTWRLFAYENNKTDEIGLKPNLPLKQGNGYWFNKTKDLSKTIDLDNAHVSENNQENLFVINLKTGWNLIGNPYPFDINWDEVLDFNNYGDTIELVTYNRSYSYGASTLKAYEGGFVYAEAPYDLVFPLNKSSESGNRIAHEKLFDSGWLVNISVENEKMKNDIGGIGMHPLAKISYDGFDRPALPEFIDQPEISFSHPEHSAEAFARDIVEWKENNIWEFVAAPGKSKKVTLSWNSQSLLKSHKLLFLYDIANDKTIDMKQLNNYEISMSQPLGFKAIYGDESFVKEALGKIKTEALAPYPNPFSHTVRFPVNLPLSQNNYDLEYSVFDLTGNMVFEKKIANVAPGLFMPDWEIGGSGSTQQGIYIYKIKVTNGLYTNNFHGRIVKN